MDNRIENNSRNQNRRQFISKLALGSVGVISSSGLGTTNAKSSRTKLNQKFDSPDITLQAPDGKVLRAGLVGCGGRGTGAAVNFLDAAPNLEIISLGDVFPDQLNKCRNLLKNARDVEIAEENCFTGFESYKKVLETNIDIILLATPPYFRPEHVTAAVEAGVHIFQEKPVAVDPVGARIMMEATDKAKDKNLCMVSGTALRYGKNYIETRKRVQQGIIGDIISAKAIRNGGALWWIERKPEWSDMEYMIRNWGNFTWLSGDHIVEQHIHHLDLINWYLGKNPVKAMGYGGRHQRKSGNQFDYFSIVYDYGNGFTALGSTRQINGTDNGRLELITGTEGYANCDGSIYNHDGELIWEYPYPDDDDPDSKWKINDPFVQEHVELITAIRTSGYINDSELQVNSTRMAIMGRMSAYTGREITWDEILNSDFRLGPNEIKLGPVEGIDENPAVVGKAPAPTNRYS
ncbi:MAG: Gfo/Idh/MocA family oxidoreductase [Balneolaceae bacterium]